MAQLSAEETRQLAHATILAQLTEGVIVTDAVGTIIFVNEAAAAIHGVARLDVRPNAYSDTYHLYREDGRPYPSEDLPLARAVRGETVTDARWCIRRPDNKSVLAIGTAQPLRSANGRRVGAVLTLRDITTQDAAERSLRKSEMALREVHKRTGEHSGEAHPGPAASPRTAAAPQSDAAGKIKASLQDILAQIRQAVGAASLPDARLHGEHAQATAAALLALIDTLLGAAEPKARSA